MPFQEQVAVILVGAGSVFAACCVPGRSQPRFRLMVLRRLLAVLTIGFIIALAFVQHDLGVPWGSPTMWILKAPMLLLLGLLIFESA